MTRFVHWWSVTSLSALLLVPTLSYGHDFWIEPSTFRAPTGTVLKVHLRVGEGFRGDAIPRNPAHIERFFLSGPEGEKDIVGTPGADPAGTIRLEKAGLALVGYRSRHRSATLEPGKFEAYLAEEGLESVIGLRAGRNEQAKPGREIYSRCAKSLVAVGTDASMGFDRLLGLRLELVPERNPYAAGAGPEMPVRVLYEGRPLAGVLVAAIHKGEPTRGPTARSDEQGRVVLALARRGVWLIKAVHMVPAPREAHADWESLWASLTFELPE